MALPPLSIPDWAPPDDGEAGWASSDRETPRSPAKGPGSLPSSPSARKTRSRAGRVLRHASSLRDTKVLVTSDLHRSESAADPSLFQYHHHFDAPWQLVGKTHLSEVFRVRHRASGAVYAVKRSRRRFRSKLQRERCLREVRAVAALPRHPNIVHQYRAWQEGGHFYIQMDYCEGGSLGQQAQRACAAGRCMPDEQLWAVACQAAHGLAFLHSHGVLHLDIKPDNIYLSLGGPGAGAAPRWRIGDFGLAVARGQDGSMDWEEGDGDYVAPELLAAGGEPSPATDLFSLGASLLEVATGHKLPRSEGWTAADADALQLPGRPPALVALLRGMLQPDPARRPSAQHVIEVVEREQPAVAAAAAEAVAVAAAAAAMAARGAGAAPASPLQQQQQQQQQQARQQMAPPPPQQVLVMAPSGSAELLVPSPFQQPRSPGSDEASGSHTPAAGAAAAEATKAAADQFSFDVPAQPRAPFALQPLRPHNHARRGGGGAALPGSTVKGTPVGRSRAGGPGRWAPALSPLISEGALTPGAVASLGGSTPGTHGSAGSAGECAPTPTLGGFAGGGGPRGGGSAATPLDARRPAPLQLPAAPQSGALAVPSSGRPSSGTQGSGDGHGWRLSRRDMLSPDSDVLAASASGSDYSFSCGTGRTTSDLDFADALSPSPMSQELAGPLGFGHGATPSTGGTPESLAGAGCGQQEPPSTGPSTGLGCHPGSGDLQQPALGGARDQASGPLRMPSLAWDLHTSPEFLMQLPPGSPDSLSRASSLDDASSLPSSRAMSVRRFPTLDSWGSALDTAASAGLACAKPGQPPGVQRVDSLAALAAQHFTHTFAAAPPAAAVAAAAAEAPAAGPPPAARALRKRQHSSRRTLMAALSRDNSVASSLDGMQPTTHRRLCDPDSLPTSPGAAPGTLQHAAAAGLHAGLPPLHGRAPSRNGSLLGREAAAAAAIAMEEAARLMAGGTPPDALSPAGTPTAAGAQCAATPFTGRALAPPSSPLHARLTCMKLRDTA